MDRRTLLGLCLITLSHPAAAETQALSQGASVSLRGRPTDIESEPLPPHDQTPFTWKSGLALGIVGTTYVTAWAFASAAWWTRENESSHLAFRDEGAFGLGTYAGGADKLGHFYTNYVATRMYTDILEWGGFSRTASTVTATLITTLFFTGVELKDGYQRNYGFSVGDLVANLSGQGAALAMMLVPNLNDAVGIKLMYFPSRDFRRAVSAGGRLDMPEDYSGQTYLLAFHLAALPLVRRETVLRPLRYVDLSLGYGTRGYEPIPRRPEPVRELVSLGFSLNLQSVCDDLLEERVAPRSTAAAVVHFVNDVYQPPSTRVSVLTSVRHGPPPTHR